MNIQVIPIKYGESELAENWIFLGGAKDKFYPISFMFYVLLLDDRVILVDTGSDTMPGYVMRNYIKPVDALERIGINRNEITDIIITHAHRDHIEAAHYYPQAVVYIQQDEYKRGKEYLNNNKEVICFRGSYMVAECIQIVEIGGHATGSCIVLFNNNNKKYLLAGDECYLKECLDKKIPTGSAECLEKSIAFLQTYGNGEYEVLLCHEELGV